MAATEPKIRTGSVQSIARAFSLLELMADAGGTPSLSSQTNPDCPCPRSTGCCGRWSTSATSAKSPHAFTFSGLD
jgi:hypothetical protein